MEYSEFLKIIFDDRIIKNYKNNNRILYIYSKIKRN